MSKVQEVKQQDVRVLSVAHQRAGFLVTLRWDLSTFMHSLKFNDVNHRDWRQVFGESYFPSVLSPLHLLFVRIFIAVVAICCMSYEVSGIPALYADSEAHGWSYLLYLTTWQWILNVLSNLVFVALSIASIWSWRKSATVDDGETTTELSGRHITQRLLPHYVRAKLLSYDLFHPGAIPSIPSWLPGMCHCSSTPLSMCKRCGDSPCIPPPILSSNKSPSARNGGSLVNRYAPPPSEIDCKVVAVVTVETSEEQPQSSVPPRLPVLLKLAWLLNSLASNIALSVMLLYWLVLVPSGGGGKLSFNTFWMHLISGCLVLINNALSRIPAHISHVVYGLVFGVLYAINTLIIYLVQVKALEGYTGHMYNVLSFDKNPVTASILLIICIFGLIPVIHGILWLCFHRRNVFVFPPPRHCCTGGSGDVTRGPSTEEKTLEGLAAAA